MDKLKTFYKLKTFSETFLDFSGTNKLCQKHPYLGAQKKERKQKKRHLVLDIKQDLKVCHLIINAPHCVTFTKYTFKNVLIKRLYTFIPTKTTTSICLKKHDCITKPLKTNSHVFMTICKHVYKGLIKYLFKYWSIIMTMRNALESAIYIHNSPDNWFHPLHNVLCSNCKMKGHANECQILFSLSALILHREASCQRGELNCEWWERWTCELDTPAVHPEPGCAVPKRCDGSA